MQHAGHLRPVSDSAPERGAVWEVIVNAIDDYLEATAPTDDQPDGHATTLYPCEMADWVLRRLGEAGYAITQPEGNAP